MTGIGPFLTVGFDLGWFNLGAGATICYPGAGPGGAPRWVSAGAKLIRYSDRDALAGRREREVERAQLKADRAALFCREVGAVLDHMRPSAVGYEDYTVYDPEGVGDLVKATKSVLGLFGFAPGKRTYANVGELARALTEHSTIVTLLERLEGLMDGYEKATHSEVSRDAGRGDAANTLIPQGAIAMAAVARGIPLFAYSPARVASRWRKGKKGTKGKEATADGVRTGVEGSADAVHLAVEKYHRSGTGEYVKAGYHCYDGLGLSVMAGESALSQLGLILPRS